MSPSQRGDFDTPPDDFDPFAIQRFWDAREDIALKRDILLKAKIVDRTEEDKATILLSNQLLCNSPDRTLRRIARLAELPHDFDIETEGRYIYIVYGRTTPYSGQTKPAASPGREAF